MTNQSLKTVVTLVGTVDSSFTQMGSLFTKSMTQSTKTVDQLNHAQTGLMSQIKRLGKSGNTITNLTQHYKSLDTQVEKTSKQNNIFKHLSKLGKTAASAINKTVPAVVKLVNSTNKSTASMALFAKSQGFSVEQFQEWGSVAKQATLSGDSISKMMGTLGKNYNKLGSLKKPSAIGDAFNQLGIDKDTMKDMSAAQQYETIMQRLLKMQDKQKAASLADTLLGGDGSKMVTYIQSTGKSLDNLLKTQQQYNVLNKQGISGATQYSSAFSNLDTVLTSSWQQLAGVIGGEMAPRINQLSKTLADFVKKHQADIVDFVDKTITAAIEFGKSLYQMGQEVNAVVQSLGGWKTVGATLSVLLAGKMLSSVFRFVSALVSIGGQLKDARDAMAAFNLVSKAKSLGGMVASIGRLGSSLLGMGKSLGVARVAMVAFNLVASLNPIGLVVMAVSALVFAGIELYRNWDKVVKWFSGALGWFKKAFPETFNFLKTLFDWTPLGLIINNWGAITGFFSALWDGITGLFSAAWDGIKFLFSWTPLGLIINNWGAITGFFSALWDGITGLFSAAWDGIKFLFSWTPLGLIINNWGAITGFFGAIWDGVIGLFSAAWDGIKSMFSWSPLDGLSEAWEPFVNFFTDIWDRVTGIFSKGGKFVGGIFKGIKGFLGFGSDDKNSENSDDNSKSKPLLNARGPHSRLQRQAVMPLGSSHKRDARQKSTLPATTLPTTTVPGPAQTASNTELSETASARATSAINAAAPGARSVTVQQNVGGITINAAPNQSAREIGQSVLQILTDQRLNALYDLPDL
ncbi:hypothetical protein [Celerinatantimonas sp. YJH-8]|uniref:phage tail protein n=1 Tax=Celerinatantimonas sp. YJH-8 TaxID=3228714 RepID=UPI0038C2D786